MMSPSSLMPHAVCWRSDSRLIWTMVVTNAVTFLSYLSICITLFFMVNRTRRVIARDWAWFLVGFALFIVACGSTHLMEVVTTWVPWFWLDATTNIVTALLSASVAISLIKRAGIISFGVNDYAERLAASESEKASLTESLLDAHKLEESSKISTVIAHEIANPLEAIQNVLYLIRESPGATPEIVDLALTAAAESDRVLTISRSTLTFFRQTTVPEPVDMLLAAESLRILLAPVISMNKVEFVLHAEGDVTVNALPGEVRQVLLNLVRNACEASTEPGSLVTLSLTGTPDEVQVVVADQGSGIAVDLLPRLFHFGVSTKGARGNGMGLWTVRHILNRHGGDVKVDSIANEGTRFTVSWPRVYTAKA